MASPFGDVASWESAIVTSRVKTSFAACRSDIHGNEDSLQDILPKPSVIIRFHFIFHYPYKALRKPYILYLNSRVHGIFHFPNMTPI